MPQIPPFEEFVRQELKDFVHQELLEFRRLVPSKTLAKSIEVKFGPGDFDFEFVIPYYWAEAYLSGRKGFGPQSARKLVYFADPKNDPRRPGGVPPRKGPERRLTRAEYEFGLMMNRQVWPDIYMYVVSSVGPAPRDGNPPRSREKWLAGVGPRQAQWLDGVLQKYLRLMLKTLPQIKL